MEFQLADIVYVGAHAVVKGNCEYNGGSAIYCNNIPPDSVFRNRPSLESDPDHYLTVAFRDYLEDPATTVNYGPYPGWCVDPVRGLRQSNTTIPVDFICTVGEDFTCGGTSIFDHPENMEAVNWLINHAKDVEPTATKNDVQWAIWKLLYNDPTNILPLSNPDYSGELKDAALNAVANITYVPECGDSVAVIVYQDGAYNSPGVYTKYSWCDYPPYGMQPFIIMVPVECQTQCGSETAWAFNYPPLDDTSAEFPGDNWFRYFGYLVN